MKRKQAAGKRGRLLRRWALPLPAELLLALLLAGAVTLLEVWIQPNPLRDTLYAFRHFPVVLLLNVIPAFLLILAFSAVTGNVCTAAAITDLLLCTLAVANRIKVGYRNEPVWPSDLRLLREVQDAVKNYHLQFPWAVIAAVLLSAVLLMLLGLVLRHRKSALPLGRRLLRRAVLLAVSCGVLTGLTFTVYASDTLYYKYPRSNTYHLAPLYCELGATYSFLHNITAKAVERPAGYSTAAAEGWDTAAAEDASGAQVHVIAVMCEGFSDITDQGIFDYGPENDPLANYHALTEDSHAISGHLTVSRFGGGTANTEYDVLTGMQASALSESTSTAFYAVDRNLDSLFRVFNADGYDTCYIHPGYDWFYNRENVCRFLGAQRSVFNDEMADAEMKGTWVTDAWLAGFVERTFEQSTAGGQKLFSYVTTIENHTVYSYDKFGEGYLFPAASLSEPVSLELQEIADVYTEGLRDNDAMIGELVEYFRESDEPVVLAFFGDHLPSLGGNIDNYAALGIEINAEETGTAQYLRACETPWVVWANDAAAESLCWDSAVAGLELPADGVISASYLGAMLLELTGRKDCTPWFSWLNWLRRQLPVVCSDTVETPEGLITNQPEAGQLQLIERWKCWSYYKLKYKSIT